MKITAKTRYACLAVLELTRHFSDESPLTVRDIGREHGLSERFLTQILLKLKKDEIVQSSRGVFGGYRLAWKPDHLTVGYIMGLFDEKESPTKEKEEKDGEELPLVPIPRTAPQEVLQTVWDRAEVIRQEYLNSTTFATLLRLVDEREGFLYDI